MLQKISFISVLAAVINKVEANTGSRCYDAVPKNALMPYYHVEMLGTVPEKSKTMEKDRYQVVVHVYTEGGGSVKVFNAIQKLEEALTDDIDLPDDYEVTLQVPTGVSQIIDEADGTKHAVIGYDFVVFSGYKMKI
jgi:cobyrinic acid a,c-diamide synthase